MTSHFDKILLGMGAMKAGTTWLYAHLAKHPKVHFTPEKELHFWAQLYSRSNPLSREYRYARFLAYLNRTDVNTVSLKLILSRVQWYTKFLMNVESDIWYKRLFSEAPAGAFKADFSNLTPYISDEGFEAIKSVSNEVRVIYVLRNPVERLWSHIKFQNKQGGLGLDLGNFEKRDFKKFVETNDLWKYSQYSEVITRLKQHFSDSELHMIFFDDIETRPNIVLENVFRFLNLDPIDQSNEDISKRINSTERSKIPDALRQVYDDAAKLEMSNLREIGIKCPETWNM